MDHWFGGGDHHDGRITCERESCVARRRVTIIAHLIFLVLPVKSHPFPSRSDERLLSNGEQAIEPNTESSDLLFVRIPFGYQDVSSAVKLHGSPRTNLLQPIPILVSE